MLIQKTIKHPHQPDEHWVMDEGGVVAARLSLWWRDVPRLPGERVGVIGHYSARADQPAVALLAHAIQRLTAQACSFAVGPMDGNTWRTYRFITDRGTEPPFFLEPDHPTDWPGQWRTAGFKTIATYFSAVGTNLERCDTLIENRAAPLAKAGMRLRSLRLEHLNEELRLLYDLSIRSFASNFLYSPLSLGEFMEQALALRNRLRPELIIIAEQAGEPVGFLFALPEQIPCGVDTVIMKTLAVLPPYRGTGLGGWLVAHAQRTAHTLGFVRVIHALMHETNLSLKVSAHYAKIFRRYELFGKRL